MLAAKKRPQDVRPPAERGVELLEQIGVLELHERIAALRPIAEAMKPLVNKTLDDLAEHTRPKGHMVIDQCGQSVIAGAASAGEVRMEMELRGGRDLLNTFLTATEDEV